MALYKYTPGLVEPEVLKKTLMGRTEELKTFDRILRSASQGKSISHPIIIGPRGIGKTHFLRIIYHAVKGEIKVKEIKDYKKYFVPVIFAEEEYLDTLEQLILLVVKHLKDEGVAVPEGLLDASLADAREREIAVSYLKTFKKKTGRILLLIVDNIDEIIGNLTEEDQGALRDILMTSGSVLLVGAAPTFFGAIEDHEKPFYNFFETVWLGELTFEESYRLLESYAEIKGRTDLLDEFKKSEPKIRAIYELAGGTPRLMLILYELMAEGDIKEIEDTFLSMLDELTPYFRDRVRDLAKQQREIVDVMARAEKLLTPTEIAERCRMPVNVVNAQLSRLERINYVKKSSKKGTRRVLYDLKEKLFGIWRQMRVEAGRKRLGFLVTFLEVWYTKEELSAHLDKILGMLRDRHSDIQRAIDMLWYCKEAIPEFKENDVVCVACQRKDYDAALAISDKELEKSPSDAKALFKRGCIYSELKRYSDAVESYRRGLEIKPKDHSAWFKLGVGYGKLERHEEAIDAFKKALEIKTDDHGAWINLGIDYGKLERHEEAINAFKKALEIKTDDHGAWHNLSANYWKLNRFEDAINAIKKAVETGPDCQTAWIDLGSLSLINFGHSLFKGEGKFIPEYLRSFLECLPHIKDDRLELFKGYSALMNDLLKRKKNVDTIKSIMKEIENAGQKELLEFLSPYVTLIRYLDTRDEEILDRLRAEEKTIVMEMLATLKGRELKRPQNLKALIDRGRQ